MGKSVSNVLVGLRPDQIDELDKLARYAGESRSSLVRLAVDAYLKQHDLPRRRSADG